MILNLVTEVANWGLNVRTDGRVSFRRASGGKLGDYDKGLLILEERLLTYAQFLSEEVERKGLLGS